MEQNNNVRRVLTEESTSVQMHLQIMQNVIQRMSANSASCKTWCITIVSAILVLVADKAKPGLVLLALLPTFLFLALDVYYLAMEKAFRSSYNSFVAKLHCGEVCLEDVYSVVPKGEMSNHQLEALRSFSVWGFYCGLLFLIALAKWYVLP